MTTNSIQKNIASWVDGEDDEFRVIFDYYLPRLHSVCSKSVKSEPDCEEITLNVLLKIWQQRQKFLEVDNFEGYLYRCLRNEMTDFHRKKTLPAYRIDLLPLSSLGSIDHPELSFKELEELYLLSLSKLPPKQRAIFLASREKGLSQKQIADQFDISVNTVNNHIKGALNVLRKDLGAYSEILPVLMIMTVVNMK